MKNKDNILNDKIRELEEIIKKNPQDNLSKFELAKIFFSINKVNKSKKITEELLVLEPENHYFLKFGAMLNEFSREYNEAILKHKLIIKIKPNEIDSYINIAKMFNFLKNYDEIINYSKQGLKIEGKNIIIFNNLIAGLLYKKNFEEAFEYIKKFEKHKNSYHIIASMGSYIKEQLQEDYQFKFINNPMEYLAEYNLSNHNKIIDNLINFIEKIPNKVWEPKNKSTRKGYQTKTDLFSKYKNEEIIQTFAQIIKLSLKKYLIKYKDSNDHFITKFPTSVSLKGWSVALEKSGYQTSHNHPNGWISGVFYLKIPTKLIKNEGKIEFSLHGYDMPVINKEISKKLIEPEEGKIILFPSTLYHKTIPFNNDDKRISLAFDVIPN